MTHSLIEAVRAHAAAMPTRTALRWLGDGETLSRELSWSELLRQAAGVAERIRRFAPGRALLLFPPGPDFVTAFLGCLSEGVVAVPAPPPKPGRPRPALERARWIARDASASVVLSTERVVDRLSRLLFETDMPTLGDLPWIATDTPADAPAAPLPWQPDPEDLAFLQYTSGSTHRPRGVMVTHGSLGHNLACSRRLAGSRNGDSVSWLPHFHDMGLIEGILRPLSEGRTAVLMPPAACLQRPERWLAAIERYRAASSGGPDFVFDLAVRKVPEDFRADLRSWQIAFTGAEMIRWETLGRFAARFAACGFSPRAFFPSYGLAEATLLVTSGPLTDWPDAGGSPNGNRDRTYVSCGRAIDDMEVCIADPDTRQRQQDGAIGEIWVRGPSVAPGYWNRPNETLRKFGGRLSEPDSRSWLRTGDLGFMREGRLFVAGRLDDRIVLRGKNYCPEDIEHCVVEGHAEAERGRVAAFSLEADGRTGLGLAVELSTPTLEGNMAIAGELSDLVASEIGLRPDAVALVGPGSIPRTSSGKVQRHRCREALRTDSWSALCLFSPATDVMEASA